MQPKRYVIYQLSKPKMLVSIYKNLNILLILKRLGGRDSLISINVDCKIELNLFKNLATVKAFNHAK
mgnify:CR=1 FL=1